MEDIARIGFQVDSRGLVEGKKKLDELVPAAGRVEAASDKLARKMGWAKDAQGKWRDEMGRFVPQTTLVANGLGNVEKRAGMLGNAFGSLRGIMAGVAAYMTVGAVVQMSDEYTSLNNVLKIVAGEQGDVNQLLNDLNGIAERTRAPLGATVQLYQRMSIASKELGVNQTQLMRFTENIGLALAQQGGSAEAASGALMQLSQGMGGSVIRAEEFNSILEGAYPILLAAAKGIESTGGSVAKLRTMMLDGKLTSKIFFDAILSQTDELEAAFAQTTPTISQAFGRLREELMLSLGAFNELTGASGGMASVLLFVANNLQQIAVYAASAAVVIGATYIPALWGMVAAAYAAVAAFVTLRGALIATGLGALIVIIGTIANAVIDLAQKVGGFGKAMSIMGELAKLVWQGIGDSAAAIPPALAGVWAFVKADFNRLISDMAFAWSDFLQMFEAGLAAFNLTAPNLSNMIAAADEAGAGALEKATAQTAEGYSNLAAAGDKVKNAFGPVNDKLAELNKTVADVPGGTNAAAGGIGALGDAAGGKGGAKGKVEELKTALQLLTEEFQKLTEPFDQASAAFEALDKAKELGIISNDAFASSLGRIHDAFLASGGSAEQWAKIVGKGTETVATQLDELGKKNITELGGAFAELATGGKASFADLAKSIIKDLLAIAWQALVVKPLLNMMGIPFGKGGTFGGGDALSGALANAGAPVGFAKGGAFTNQMFNRPTPFKFASGGGFASGVMGEAGPEAVMPLTRGPDGSLGVQMYSEGANAGMRAAGGASGRITLHVVGEEGPMFRPTIRAEAEGVAVEVTGQAVNQMNEQLPSRVDEILQDPRMR